MTRELYVALLTLRALLRRAQAYLEELADAVRDGINDG